jgi:hypothetical protein
MFKLCSSVTLIEELCTKVMVKWAKKIIYCALGTCVTYIVPKQYFGNCLDIRT